MANNSKFERIFEEVGDDPNEFETQKKAADVNAPTGGGCDPIDAFRKQVEYGAKKRIKP